MEKPIGYDQTEAKQFNQQSRPDAGAYVMRIDSAVSTTSQNGRPMIVLCLDIAQGEYSGNFRNLWEYLKKSNSEAKWPCVHRRCIDDEQLAFFKGDIKAIEESNLGFIFNWDEKTLRGKFVGAMLREKVIGENQDGSAKTVLEVGYLCSKEKALSGKLKPMKIKSENDKGSYQTKESQEPLPF